MARWWKERAHKEPYLDYKGNRVNQPFWYYVYVCSFTFHFGSLEDIRLYIEHYETKIFPSSRIPNFVRGPLHGDHGEAQRWHENLPLRLREGTRREKVIKALKAALADFEKTKGRI